MNLTNLDNEIRKTADHLSGTFQKFTQDISGKMDNPTGGTAGQILRKTQEGTAWDDEVQFNPVNIPLENVDCDVPGIFTADFSGKQIQKFNVQNAVSGALTLNCSTVTSQEEGIAPTVEIQIPITGSVSTINVPAGINVIDIPVELEFDDSGTVTYHDFVIRAEKDLNGTWAYYLNHAYAFTETEEAE